MTFTIAGACRLQRDLDLLFSHVAYVDIDSDWFVLAHTDTERQAMHQMPLECCPVHVYLQQGNLDRKLCCAGSPGHAPAFVFPDSGWYQLPSASLHEVRGLAL